jgi:hypothetical protein
MLSFIARYPLPAGVAALGVMLTALGYAQQGYEIWRSGVEAWQLQAAGAFLFATAVSIMLYRWDQERKTSEPAPAPAPPPATPTAITSHSQSGGVTAHTINVATNADSNGRFDKLYAVYKATDDFRRKAFTTGVNGGDINSFYDVIKEARFLFGPEMASHLEREILAKGNEIYSLDNIDAVQDRAERSRLIDRRRELTEWLRKERIPLRERFAEFIKF